jgi:hypothetical protein
MTYWRERKPDEIGRGNITGEDGHFTTVDGSRTRYLVPVEGLLIKDKAAAVERMVATGLIAGREPAAVAEGLLLAAIGGEGL